MHVKEYSLRFGTQRTWGMQILAAHHWAGHLSMSSLYIRAYLSRMLKNYLVLWCSNADWVTYNSIPTPTTQREHQTHRIKGSAVQNRPPSGPAMDTRATRPIRSSPREQLTELRQTLHLHFMVFTGDSCQCRRCGSIPGSGRSPGWRNHTHSSILTWRIPWIEKPGGLQPTGLRHWACKHDGRNLGKAKWKSRRGQGLMGAGAQSFQAPSRPPSCTAMCLPTQSLGVLSRFHHLNMPD